MSCYLIDALDLGTNLKGVSRVLGSLVPELDALSGDELRVACTREGAELLQLEKSRMVVVSRPLQSRWEQWDLPSLARRICARAIYSHREAGALWGPPLVLHVPENPEVRWARQGVVSARDRARRRYSRLVMRRSLRHAAVVGASVPSVAAQLSAEFAIADVRVLPLGVDLRRFCPDPHPAEDSVFHLGSMDPRDCTKLVVEAYAGALRRRPELPSLVIGGDLGSQVNDLVRSTIARHGLSDRVRLPGRLDDATLADLYRRSLVVVQPSSDEGFGLQPLEALASGAAVLLIPNPAVLDVVGSAALAVENHGLSDALVRLYDDAALRAHLRVAGPKVAAGYSWRRAGELVLAALSDAAAIPAAARGPTQ